MKQKSDCDVFQQQLDAFKAGRLGKEARASLQGHADSCPECAVLLRLHDHLALPPQEELEAAIPVELLASLRSRLATDLATRRAVTTPTPQERLQRDWRTPALAAAAVVLLASVGLLYAEVRKLQGRERALIEQVAEQQSRLTEDERRTSVAAVARTAGLAGSSAWQRLLARKGRISVAELDDLLARLPSGTTVYSRAEFEALMANAPIWLTSAWRARLAEIETEDGIQSEELLRMLDETAIDPRRSISTARLLALSQSGGRS